MAHSLEEHWTEFFDVHPFFPFLSRYLGVSTQLSFIVFSLLWWLLLLSIAFLMLINRFPMKFSIVFGLVYIYELHHLFKAALAWSYYPGVWSALLFPIIGFFFWRELLRNLLQTRPQPKPQPKPQP